MRPARKFTWMSVTTLALLIMLLLTPLMMAASLLPSASGHPAQTTPAPDWELPSEIDPYDTPQLEAFLNTTLADDPTNWRALALRGELYLENGAFRLARQDIEAALTLRPNDLDLLLLRARVNLGVITVDAPMPALDFFGVAPMPADYVQAEADIEAVLAIDPNHYEAHLMRGILAYEQGNQDLADQAFAQAIELNPKDGRGYYYRGMAFIIGEFGELIRYAQDVDVPELRQAADRLTANPKGIVASVWWHHLQAQWEEVFQTWELGVERFPAYAPLFFFEAVYFEAATQGRSEFEADVLKALDSAVQLAPFSPRYLVARGLALVGDSPDEAALDFQAALALEPEDLTAIFQLYEFNISTARLDCGQARKYLDQYQALHEKYGYDKYYPPADLMAGYNRVCEAPTPIPTSQAVTDPRYPPGTTITLKGFAGLALGSTPGAQDAMALCVGGETATVGQTVEVGGIRYVELQCEAGTGWIAEALAR